MNGKTPHTTVIDELHGVDLSNSDDQTVYRIYKVTPELLTQVEPNVDDQLIEFMIMHGIVLKGE